MGLHEPFTILRNVRATTSSYLPELARNLQGLFVAIIRARPRLFVKRRTFGRSAKER
jgi:hypothetical protein